jgi:hypothetical protein
MLKKKVLLTITLVYTCLVQSQSILHPTNSKSIVKLTAGNTYQYFDDGGAAGKYGANINSLITIYPANEGEFVSISCDSLALASDTRMYIFDGNHPGSAILGYFNGKVGIKGKTYTASSDNASGALSIRFISLHRRVPWRGWNFTVSTTKIAGSVPASTTQDCSGAIKVCSDSTLITIAKGKGVQELPGPGFWSGTINDGNNGEIQSNWYKFEVKTPGKIEFLITPNTFTDFDWGLWGPYKAHECPAWTTDMYYRASACAGKYQKGLTGLSASTSKPVGRFNTDECFVAAIDVKAGEHYVIMIDDWSGKHSTFKLSWTFSNGASLECEQDKEPPIVPEEIVETIEEEVIPEIDSSEFEKDTVVVEEVIPEIDSSVVEKDTVVIEDIVEEPLPYIPQIEANLTEDQQFVVVKYPGAFEWKIENAKHVTIRTGNAVDSKKVDISKLPAGKYRVSLIHKKIRQYDSFIKE